MRIIIAEDELISRKVLETTLTKWGYEVQVTCDGQEAFEALQADDAPRLAVLDWMMPKMDGPTVCQKLRAIKGGEYFYLILLTAKDSKKDTISGLEAGADDYVIKPFDKRELLVRVGCGERIIKLQSDLISTRDALKIQATHDALTGLLNRAAVYDTLSREQNRIDREGGLLSVIMVDLDYFKCVNDTFGHAAGDLVLRETAHRMKEASRNYDTVARLGGEEFLIVMPGATTEEAVEAANRIREFLATESVDIGARLLDITASMGVAGTDTVGNQISMDELVHAADEALYQAKEGGRNRVESAVSVHTIY